MSEITAKLSTALANRYKIERQVGEGGMATVYLAHDLKHDRKVALKVFRPELAAILGGERFLNEITVTANLQHPNILPVYDSGEADGFLYYVMPYLEGETLRERIVREKQLAVEETVALATSVAGALQFAHQRGVIHRDIKPENILLQSGQPLVADFGIALAVTNVGGHRLTETGVSLGTPYYMSPEQATGERELDARSDIYALGATVYEMLVGEPPHVGNSVQAIVARILADPPTPITRTRELVPPNVDAAVQKALAKSPADRFASAEKFADALSNPAFRLSGTTTVATPVEERISWKWKRLSIAMTGLALVMTGVVLWALARPTALPAPVTRHRIVLPEWDAQSGQRGRIAFAPDGSSLAYIGRGSGGTQIWVLARDRLRATPLPGTEAAGRLFVSADGTHFGFFQSGQIKILSLQGGEPVTIASDARGTGASWGTDGFVYFTSLHQGNGIARVPSGGGTIERLTVADAAQGETLHGSPEALPNGKGVVFALWRGNAVADRDIAVLDLATGEYRVVARGVIGRYAASGHLLWITADGTMRAAPFDQDRLRVTRDPKEIAQGISLVPTGDVDLALSETGTLLYAAGNALTGLEQAVWVERDGTAIPVDSAWFLRAVYYGGPVLSPDGMSVALSQMVSERGKWDRWDVWIRRLGEGTNSRLTFEGSENVRPSWTLDGRSVMFASRRGSPRHSIWVKPADGAQPAQLLLSEERPIFEVVSSPDGSWLIYRTDDEAAGRGDIMGIKREDLPVEEDNRNAIVPLIATDFSEVSPTFSPDGRWLAYVSDETGTKEVYVRPFPNVSDRKWQVSQNAGTEPLWSHGGREIFYLSGEGDLVAAEVATTPTFAIRSRRVLFNVWAGRYRTNSAHPFYDVTPDDRRFLMIRPVERVSDRIVELVLVDNFFEELKAKVGN